MQLIKKQGKWIGNDLISFQYFLLHLRNLLDKFSFVVT